MGKRIDGYLPNGQYDRARAEVALWRMVIHQAVMDAQSPVTIPWKLKLTKKMEYAAIREQAIKWLTGGSKDFATVCLAADLDPGYVQRKVERILKEGIRHEDQ